MDEIFERVSIRKYHDRPIEAEKIENILRAAMAAPSAGNQQPWEFFVVTDKNKIKELSKCSQYSSCAENAPAVIVPCYRTYGLKFPEFDLIDLSIATENILLEIASQGLGGVWLAVAPIEERIKKVDSVLGIGKELHAFALVPLGYPNEEKKQQDRFDKTRIHYY
ncbi:MAG: nitroreductase family protein [Firmicutes bacterium]|nr:nitroreductase family protein [Bacillota bacterium]